MTYEQLMSEIMSAKIKMLSLGVEPHALILSPKAFNTINAGSDFKVMFQGMEVQVADLQPSYQFIMGRGEKDSET